MEVGIIAQIDVTGNIVSGHDIIEITSNLDLRQLNFHHEKVDWREIKEILKNMHWKNLFESLNNKECIDLFIYCIEKV